MSADENQDEILEGSITLLDGTPVTVRLPKSYWEALQYMAEGDAIPFSVNNG